VSSLVIEYMNLHAPGSRLKCSIHEGLLLAGVEKHVSVVRAEPHKAFETQRQSSPRKAVPPARMVPKSPAQCTSATFMTRIAPTAAAVVVSALHIVRA
jgi:hypothetical protein